ncbi:hypothetical protein [Bosea sp. TAF32]|uniref:hypothetical protein n=1 Tax=Bosea sp. TAF32 TaxID=3237482 RepID=UPI003F922BD7
MKKFLAAACGLFLTGCAAFGGAMEPPGLDPMQSTGETYVPRSAGGFEPPPAEEHITSTCTMKGQNVNCY